jgi:hypothetical protein
MRKYRVTNEIGHSFMSSIADTHVL